MSSLVRCVLATLVLLVGCGARDHLELDARWAPLKRIQVRAANAPGVFTTISPVVYAHSLADFDVMDSTQQDGLLLHEQLHAIRQESRGVTWWLAVYAVDARFRWEEEQLGWSRQIDFVHKHGGEVDEALVAAFLSGPAYSVLGVPMTSYDAALAWVHSLAPGSPR